MVAYPFNLILAVAVASATVFLGFLPTHQIKTGFFARETIRAAIAWALIGMFTEHEASHYYVLISILCFGSWWQLRKGNGLAGKMWLSIASGLGISIGVMLILTTTPQIYPLDLPEQDRALLLASIYLGGATIGLAYVCYMLERNLNKAAGITSAMIQRYIGLLLWIAVARAGVLAISFYFKNPLSAKLIGTVGHDTYYRVLSTGPRLEIYALLALGIIVLPVLAFLAQKPGLRRDTALIGICLLGLIAEVFARTFLL